MQKRARSAVPAKYRGGAVRINWDKIPDYIKGHIQNGGKGWQSPKPGQSAQQWAVGSQKHSGPSGWKLKRGRMKKAPGKAVSIRRK